MNRNQCDGGVSQIPRVVSCIKDTPSKRQSRFCKSKVRSKRTRLNENQYHDVKHVSAKKLFVITNMDDICISRRGLTKKKKSISILRLEYINCEFIPSFLLNIVFFLVNVVPDSKIRSICKFVFLNFSCTQSF